MAREVIGYLTERFPNTQFIVTSHSPLIVQAAAGANIALLRREGDHVVIENHPETIRGWRIDQILTSDLFGLETARPPDEEKLLLRRKELLTRPRLTKSDRNELKEIEEKIGPIPTGESFEQAKDDGPDQGIDRIPQDKPGPQAVIRIKKPEQAPAILKKRGRGVRGSSASSTTPTPERGEDVHFRRFRFRHLRREVGQASAAKGPAWQVCLLRIQDHTHRLRRRRAFPAQGRLSTTPRWSSRSARLLLAGLRVVQPLLLLPALQPKIQAQPLPARRCHIEGDVAPRPIEKSSRCSSIPSSMIRHHSSNSTREYCPLDRRPSSRRGHDLILRPESRGDRGKTTPHPRPRSKT